MRKYLVFLFLIVFGTAGAEETVFSENFREPDSLKKWRTVSVKDGATFTVKDEALEVSHGFVEGGAGYVEIPVPRIEKGRLDFDVEICSASGGVGLILELYNISTFWHDARKEWRFYFPEPNAKRLPFFNIEPVGHGKIAEVKSRVFQHYRIRFDEKADLVEFYVDDMVDPLAARYDVSVYGHAFYLGGTLRIGSFGYAPVRYSTRIRNIVLTKDETAGQAGSRKNLILVFDGMSMGRYRTEKNVPRDKNDVMRIYRWDCEHMFRNGKNAFCYAKTPSSDAIASAKYIIFSDAPNVPEPVAKKIVRSVQDGADLLIMGGLFTLSKGCFKDSPLERHLPVKLASPFNLKTLKKPVRISLDGAEGELYVYQDLKPADGAEILLSADGIPLMTRKRVGKGSITVFAGTNAGPDGKNSFWNTPVLKKIFELGLKQEEKK